NFYRALHIARRVLEPGVPSGAESSYLGFQGEVLILGHPEQDQALWIDVEVFESAVQLARSSHDPSAYADAVALYTGDLLPDDRFDDWVIRRRERLQLRYADVLRDAAQTYEAHGNVLMAIDTLRQLVTAQPTDEE